MKSMKSQSQTKTDALDLHPAIPADQIRFSCYFGRFLASVAFMKAVFFWMWKAAERQR